MDFAPDKRLALSYGMVTAIIFALLAVSLFVMHQSNNAISAVVQQSQLVSLAKQGMINLASAGQLPWRIAAERHIRDLAGIEAEMQDLRQDFQATQTAMGASDMPDAAQALVAQFLEHGTKFYASLAACIPLRQQMLRYYTEYQGEARPLTEVLLQRELDHVNYVRALQESIVQKKLLVGTLDYNQCALYQWYQKSLPQDEDLAEIIIEEIDPLHQKLHNYAAMLNDWLATTGPKTTPPVFMDEARADIAKLSLYFAGLRTLAQERSTAAAVDYQAQLVRLENIFREADASAAVLESHLRDVCLYESLTRMRHTTAGGKGLIWGFAILASVLTLFIAKLTFDRVSAWSKELGEAYRDLQLTHAQMLQSEKLASIGQLAAGVAHEINNPMGFITSNLGTLDKYAIRLTAFIQAQAELIASIKDAALLKQIEGKRKDLKIDYILEDMNALIAESLEGADRIKNIVQSLKSFARVDQTKKTMADLNECLETTLTVVWNELKYKCTVSKEFGELSKTLCFPQQLNQVFVNLLVNAAQSIDQTGQLTIKTWHGGPYNYIWIEDTGCGIPEDKIGKIFDPFFTTKEVGKGTGLGLSIVYDIIKKHHGSITVDSEVGKGTTFVIRLPVTVENGENGV
jgi:signal transduction histidine kinase